MVITLEGTDRQLLGEVAAAIRKLRPPEPYKGKGVRYANEVIAARPARPPARQEVMSMAVAAKDLARGRRQARVRKQVRGTDARPRLSVFRSDKHIYVQVISDETGRTLAAASTSRPTCATEQKTAATATPPSASARHRRLCQERAIRGRRLRPQRLPLPRSRSRVAERAREAGLKF